MERVYIHYAVGRKQKCSQTSQMRCLLVVGIELYEIGKMPPDLFFFALLFVSEQQRWVQAQ